MAFQPTALRSIPLFAHIPDEHLAQLVAAFQHRSLAAGEVLEKHIRVPDSWLRGFLQVQSAATLPFDHVRLAPMDLYNTLRHLRMHGDRKGKRRGLRFELTPAQQPKVVLEPWETVFDTTGEVFKGRRASVVRVWGRRRLMTIRRMLPYVESVDVYLLGSGLPRRSAAVSCGWPCCTAWCSRPLSS